MTTPFAPDIDAAMRQYHEMVARYASLRQGSEERSLLDMVEFGKSKSRLVVSHLMDGVFYTMVTIGDGFTGIYSKDGTPMYGSPYNRLLEQVNVKELGKLQKAWIARTPKTPYHLFDRAGNDNYFGGPKYENDKMYYREEGIYWQAAEIPDRPFLYYDINGVGYINFEEAEFFSSAMSIVRGASLNLEFHHALGSLRDYLGRADIAADVRNWQRDDLFTAFKNIIIDTAIDCQDDQRLKMRLSGAFNGICRTLKEHPEKFFDIMRYAA